MVEQSMDVWADLAPCRLGQDERRVMCRALVYWEGLRKGDALPTEFDVQATKDGELLPFLYIIRLARNLPQSLFTYCGPVMASACGGDPTGLPVAEALPATIREQVLDFFKSAVQFRQPLADCGSFLNSAGYDILYRNVVMPLAGVEGHVDHLLGAFSYRQQV